MFKKKRNIFAGVILLIVLGYLGFTSLQHSTAYYYNVDELFSGNVEQLEGNVKINGKVVPGTVDEDTATGEILFIVSGETYQVPVSYSGVLPDAFGEDNDVVLEGYLDNAGIFRSHTIAVKCPSRYVAEEEEG